METLTKFDNPGDCQTTTTTKVLTKPANENKPTTTTTTTTKTQIANKELKATAAAAATNATTTTTAIIVKHATLPTPAATNKSKSQQQQQHQFRAPQQFVKHKKTSASTANNNCCNATAAAAASTSLNNNKKNKCWNKRQNRSTKQNAIAAGTTNNASNTTTLTTATTNLNEDVTKQPLASSSSKADLENIQNLKNQQHYQNNSTPTSGNSESRIAGQGGFAACLTVTSDKLGYGHLKQQQQQQQQQQLHKRPLPSHRGGGGGGNNGNHNNHHHHVLCSGSAHNTLGGAGGGGGPGPAGNGSLVGGGGVPNSSLTCCHINGCSSHTKLDQNSSGNNPANNVASTIHVCCLRSKFFLPDKRPRKGNFIPPTKFLLGGNISDPLNLNSLQNEASSACSNNTTPATTPRQSPITTPPKVEVIIPPNIHDPLHLLDPVDSMEYEKQLTSPMKRGISLQASLALGLRPGGLGQVKSHKHRHRKNRKPKRRRYDSFNSTTSTLTDSLDDPNMSSVLSTSSFTTEKSVSSLLSVSLELENTAGKHQQDAHSAGSSCCDGGDDDELSEHNLHSPQELSSVAQSTTTTTITTSVTTSATTTANATEEHSSNIIVATHLVPSPPPAATQLEIQEVVSVETTSVALKDDGAIVGGGGVGGGGGVLNAAAEIVLATRERACRDLRLDLISTTTGSGSTTTSCGSSVVSGGNGGRKRKISESNNSQKNKKYFRVDSMDKIVSPVVPQPGAWKRPPRTTATGARKSQSRRSTSISETTITDLSPVEDTSKAVVEDIARVKTPELVKVEPKTETIKADEGRLNPDSADTAKLTTGEAPEETISELTTKAVDTKNALILAENVKKEIISSTISPKLPHPKFSVDGKKYRYGNYDRYAGLRHLNEVMDIRLQVFLQYPELFKHKDILDIGCNVGQMTISVARKLAPKSILGLDIDMDLIARARRNLSMYVRIPTEMMKKELMEEDIEAKDVTEDKQKKGRRRRKKKKLQHHQPHSHHHRHHHQTQQGQAQSQSQQPHQPHGSYAHWQHFHQHVLHYHLLHHHHHHHHHHHLYLQQESSKVDTSNFFPISFPLSYGGITTTNSNTKATSPQNIESQSPASTSTTTRSTPGHPATSIASYKASNTAHSTSTTHKPHLMKTKNDFPNNVFFRQTNYVLKDETMLANDTQQYDLILCLSVTKWIHLNFGDAGLKSAFKRMFNQLRPGGKLILEAQNWASYKKKKNLTEDIYNNYHNIEFYPNKFHEYLLSSEVGFSHSYTLGIPKHLSKGFSRPIQLYAKGDFTPNHVRWSDAYYPQTPFEAYRGIYATMPTKHGIHSAYPLISSSRSQTYDTPHYMGGGGTSGPYSCRQTPMHQPSTSQYYNPLESDSYQPSYDMEYLNHMYVFASPLYQTVWSPPTSMRKSSSHTPAFGSVRDAEFEGDGTVMTGGSYHKHVYPPNDDTSSPNANAMNAFNSIRDPDTDDSNQQKPHVYATNCGESSTSPQTNLNATDAETLEALMMDDDRSDLSEA